MLPENLKSNRNLLQNGLCVVAVIFKGSSIRRHHSTAEVQQPMGLDTISDFNVKGHNRFLQICQTFALKLLRRQIIWQASAFNGPDLF